MRTAPVMTCYPHKIEPVENLAGETVAAICSRCLDAVPMAWLTLPQPPSPPPPGRNPSTDPAQRRRRW